MLASMEELRQLDFIDNRGSKEDLNTASNAASDEKKMGVHVKPNKTVSKKNMKIAIKNPVINNAVRQKKKNRSTFTVNPFTPEEDKILLEAMSSGEELDFKKLAKKMNRAWGSVKHRVEKLKLSGGVSTITKQRYNLQEDLKIIDSAVENLKKFAKLDDTPLKDAEDLAASFRRKGQSVRNRWEKNLKVWVKSYYTKTLNLNIKVISGENRFSWKRLT